MAKLPVYRIQHRETGDGPYYGARAVGSALEYSLWRHPEPQDDGIPWAAISERKHCGFASKECVVNWFSETDLKFLHGMGFEVAVYLVPEAKITRGQRQVLFPKTSQLSESIAIPAFIA